MPAALRTARVTVQLNVRIDPEIRSEVVRLASANGVSLTDSSRRRSGGRKSGRLSEPSSKEYS